VTGRGSAAAARLSVVVVAYNSRDELPASLGALAGVPEVAEVVVVDHGGDGSAAVAADLGATVLRDASNPGYGTGQNRGVASTTGEYLLLLNPDAVVDPGGIREGVAVLDAAPDVAAVQGVIRNRTTGRPERSQGVALGPVHLMGRAAGARRLLRFDAVRAVARRVPVLTDHVVRTPDRPVDVESLSAAALLVRRSAFEQVEGFDEGYFLYSEDLDLCRRLRAAGWRLVALPVGWAEHASGASSAGWWERELVWWEGTLRYAALWWSRPAWAGARLATLLRVVPMLVARPRRAPEVLARLVLAPRRQRRSRRRPQQVSGLVR
jgi:N-acetylglucosaminyl-diphospho-decaprenol L-rhamnosyltransferase